MYKVYKYDGHYIQGELISKHTTESAAMKSAKKNINFKSIIRCYKASFLMLVYD